MGIIKIVLAFFYLSATIGAYNLSCVNPQNETVPWFFSYKYPRNVSAESPRFAYVDSTLFDFEFVN